MPKPAGVKEDVERFLKPLSELGRQIVKLLHGLADGYSYSPEEVSRIFAITPERVQEIEAEAIVKLKSQASEYS